ncbi:hypothetical protein Oscil6304_3762 [Oscillatoria acuminata PCC 6304]|uniref:Uncharacterized protein n=1 Tax=Oscillatoria acuminata PCC 6304 TaxID=56110 RepID=K9TLB3_9CYAN|nr:hypothetical protein Oscil6304_3762 [Oscillatoria acuminata PCC 6304]
MIFISRLKYEQPCFRGSLNILPREVGLSPLFIQQM